MRVLVNTQAECATTSLGTVNNMWRPMPGRIKDYISQPKANMYQSLHTTVIHPGMGMPFEVQIRTFEMHRIAEYGIAAHWRYKEGKAADELDKKLSWLRRILDWQNDARDPNDFGEMLKFDLFADEVLVFTPKGDVVSLPQGATPLDFAYRIHSAVGNRCIGAKINHRIVPLNTLLKTGDFVELMTSSSSRGPSRDWLNIVKTSEAKAKIRAWLKREERDENIVHGREMLEREAKRLGYALSSLNKPELVEPLYKRFSVQSLDDLYAMVGFGGLSTQQVLNRLIEEYRKSHKAEEAPVIEAKAEEPPARKPQPSSSSSGVIVKGESGMLVRLARCCNPLPGDKIIGYTTRGRGVSVHRADCVSLKDSGIEPERLIEVEWENQTANTTYEAEIRVISYNRTGLLAELSVLFASQEIPVSAISAHAAKNETYVFHVSIVIKSMQQLNKVIRDIGKIPDVIDVSRVSGASLPRGPVRRRWNAVFPARRAEPPGAVRLRMLERLAALFWFWEDFMRCVVQRVSRASVTVAGERVSEIGRGFMVLVGALEGDGEEDARYCADKIAGLRVFEDDAEKMNLSVADVGGEVLLVSQFTLLGDARHGRRPSFTRGAAGGRGAAVRPGARPADRARRADLYGKVPHAHGGRAGQRRPGHHPAGQPARVLTFSQNMEPEAHKC